MFRDMFAINVNIVLEEKRSYPLMNKIILVEYATS